MVFLAGRLLLLYTVFPFLQQYVTMIIFKDLLTGTSISIVGNLDIILNLKVEGGFDALSGR